MRIVSFIIVMVLLTTSCEKTPTPINEEELITTLVFTLDAVGNNQDVVMTFKDPDGNGGIAPTITTNGVMKSGETYNGSLTLLNESENPVINITAEIEAEAEAHQFFYAVSGALAGNIDITYEDKDKDNLPLGLKTKVVPRATGSGKLKLLLRHEPNKKAVGVSTGIIDNAGGETDLEVSFDLVVN
ncbi:MAG: type 1 periplasmic binding fold superfamily protein [Saprospiraceae bacterium]|nr:type 1 periplasmic binding fold superfamily protein [Saprospiraceae bacterium]